MSDKHETDKLHSDVTGVGDREDSTNPADVINDGSTKPADVVNDGSTKPTEATDDTSTKPADVMDDGSTKPAEATDDASTASLDAPPSSYKAKSFADSFGYAVDGILHSVLRERNMRFDFFVAALVLIFSLFFRFSKLEFALLSITVLLVMMAEMFNTAIENVVDLATEGKYSAYAKIAKDVAAGAVLLTSINALIVGYLLFVDKFSLIGDSVYRRIRSNPAHATFIAIALVLIFVIVLKALFYRGHGTPLHGGSVSGHAALAFCLATIGAFLTDSTAVAVLFFVVALLVAESRYEAKIHSITEIVLGAMLGTIVAGLIFMVFS